MFLQHYEIPILHENSFHKKEASTNMPEKNVFPNEYSSLVLHEAILTLLHFNILL